MLPWYIPLISAFVGAILGFVASIFVAKIQFNRQVNHDRTVLMSSFVVEVSSIIKLFRKLIASAAPETRVCLPSKKEIESICSVYRGNCGRIGNIPQEAANAVVEFYTSILSLQPSGHIGDDHLYDVADLQECVRHGEVVCDSIKQRGAICSERS